MLGDVNAFNLRLLGTDISNRAVAQASCGLYNKSEMDRDLPGGKLERYFSAFGTGWKINDDIRAMVTFSSINLLEDFSSLGRFDIIFCRNVAIYFSDQDKASLINRLARALESDGTLVIGATESISGICPQLESQRHLRSVFYQLANSSSPNTGAK